MDWQVLAPLFGEQLDKVLLAKIEYLQEENRIYRKRLGKLKDLEDHERVSLSLKACQLGKKHVEDICSIFSPDTVLRWHRKILSKSHTYPSKKKNCGGRPSTLPEIERKLITIAQENRLWGYGKLVGALKDKGHMVSKSTVRRLLKKNGIPPVKDRKKFSSWHQFIKTNKEVLFAGDFLTVDVFNGLRVTTYYVLFFIHVASRKVYLGGVTDHPHGRWLQQVARNMTMDEYGPMQGAKHLIVDNDAIFQDSKFRKIIKDSGIKFVKIGIKSPDLNCFAERWVRSIREDCLNHLIIVRRKSLDYAIKEYIRFYNRERNHQGMQNDLLIKGGKKENIRLGGLLRYYGKAVA